MNIGRAPFEVRGSRSGGTATTMQVTQRVYDTSGGSQDLAIPTTMGYGGDGHGHWHVADLTTTELVRLGNGVKVGTGAKGGFCFFDNAALRLLLPGAPQAVTYPGSGGTASSLDVTMGLSVGWGDAYRWNLPDQYVDITGPTATPATRVATTRVATDQSLHYRP